MPAMQVVLDGEGQFQRLKGRKIHKAEIEAITALPRGTNSGRTSVAIIVPLEDGSYVFAETTLRLLQQAAAAFTACYVEE